MLRYLGIILFLLYFVVAWHTLHQSADPAVPCRQQQQQQNQQHPIESSSSFSSSSSHLSCYRPLVVSGDALTMQLWLFLPSSVDTFPTDDDDDDDDDLTKTRYPKAPLSSSFTWKAVEHCQWELTLPLETTSLVSSSSSSFWGWVTNHRNETKRKDNTTTTINTDSITGHYHQHHYHCNVTIPVWARRRSTVSSLLLHQQQQPPPPPNLQARFVFQQQQQRQQQSANNDHDDDKNSENNNNNNNDTDMVVVAVTTPFQLTRTVMEERKQKTKKTTTKADTTTANDDDDDDDDMIWIPYLRYGRGTPIRVRFVNERRLYGQRKEEEHHRHHHHRSKSHSNNHPLYRSDGLRYRVWNATHYAPYMYVDELALPHGVRTELAPPAEASTSPPVPLHIRLTALSPVVDALRGQMVQGLHIVERTIRDAAGRGGADEVLDEIRYFLADERLYRFLWTQIISYLHVWFEYMAFADEIRFYRGSANGKLSGISSSTVTTRFVCSIVILLYLLDNRGTTSWIVLVSMLSSCILEAWKIWKLLRPTWKSTFPFVATRQLASGSQEQKVAEYDRIAMKWLVMGLYPLIAAWSIYTYKQHEYKSVYSWFISNAANAVYTFGFISLCPQLYVNYRLKSVAHLPWKVFMYKIFNTFIDDVFAFVIEMPWKHRLMTLRDDVVFLIFLVQVYLYRVDKTRTNEFGYSYEESDNNATTKDDAGSAHDTHSDKVKED